MTSLSTLPGFASYGYIKTTFNKTPNGLLADIAHWLQQCVSYSLNIIQMHSTHPSFRWDLPVVLCKGKGKVIPLQAWCGPEGG